MNCVSNVLTMLELDLFVIPCLFMVVFVFNVGDLNGWAIFLIFLDGMVGKFGVFLTKFKKVMSYTVI